MMKILLVQPPKSSKTIGGEDVFIFEPLALEYVASGVITDHDVRILDMRLERDIESVLAEFNPNIVGITAYTVHVNVVKVLFEKVKARNPGTLTVVGGHHATVMPDDFLTPSIDLIVEGEGVFSFKEIVRRFEKREPFEGIPGTICRNGDNPSRTECDTAIDLDSVPFPERTLTTRYRSQYYSEWMKPLASIRTSKGCPHRCNFCAQWKVAGGRYHKRDPRRVLEELADIREECVFFADDESLIDAPRMTLLANLIKEAGIRKRYFLYGRSDTIVRHPELLQLWRDIGLERVFVGVESFRDEDLEFIRKGSTSEDNDKAIRILQDLGIDVYASFIVRQNFTRKDFALLRRYCRRMGLSYASYAVLTPLPGTDLYQDVKDQLLTHNYDYFDFIHTLLPTELSLKDFYAEYRRLYMKAIPITHQFRFLKQFPLKEIPGTIVKGQRFYKRLKTTHLDYSQ